MSKEKLDNLSEKEREVLNEAVKVLYFTDSSDYGTSLYKIIKVLLDLDSVDEDDVIDLYNEIE